MSDYWRPRWAPMLYVVVLGILLMHGDPWFLFAWLLGAPIAWYAAGFRWQQGPW